MKTWLSRVLIFVFMFQVIAPQLLQAQDTFQRVQQGVNAGKDARYLSKVREIDQEFNDWRTLWIKDGEFDLTNPEDQEVFQLLEEPQLQRVRMLKILWFDRIFFDGRHAKLWEDYYSPRMAFRRNGVPTEKTVCKLYNVIKDLHTESSWMDQVENEIRKKESQEAFNRAYNAERQGQVGAMAQWQKENIQNSLSGSFALHQAFTRSVKNGTISLDELTEYIDPWRPGDVSLERITVAGEIWGNTLDAWVQNPQPIESEEDEDGNVWNEDVFNRALDEMLLKLQLRVVYRLSQLKALSYRSDAQSIQAAGTLHLLLLKIRNFYQAQGRPNPLESRYYPCGLNYSVGGPYSTETISSLFYKQVQSFSRSDFDENSKEYHQFLLLMDYAVAYEVARNFMGNIELYVKLLNAPLKKNKYKQRLSPALEHLFLFWYENIRYNNNKNTQNLNDIIKMFSQYTDEQKYALPTRIFALEVLSHLVYTQNKGAVRQHLREENESLGTSQVFYNYEISDEWRNYWAQLVADIYCPLVRTGTYSMQDYGLDSSQMQKLADKLGSIYAGFVRKVTANPDGPQLWSAEYKANTCTVLVSGNPVNMLKQKKEREALFMQFVGEAIFWVYGGEIFAFVGTAFRITRGAVMALPRAVKASQVAAKGRRGMAFALEIQKSARMANLSQNFARNGVSISATRVPTTVKEAQLAKPLAEGAASTTTTATTAQTVKLSSNHALRNEYSAWNPYRWFGGKPGPVLEYQVVQQTPGLGMQIGRVSGAKLPNGIRSYQDLRIFRNNLFDATGRRMSLNTYSFADQQLLKSEAFVLRSVDKMGKSGAFDLWIPNPNGQYYSLRSLSSKEQLSPLLTQYLQNPTEGLLITSAVETTLPSVKSLAGMSGVRVSWPEVLSGTWKNRVAAELYQPLDWGGTVSNLLMPRYVPRYTSFIDTPSKMMLGSFNSSSFARGLVGTSAFFLGLDVADRIAYPSYSNWINSTAQQEQEILLQPYSDTFDPQKMQEDAQYEKEVLESLEEQGFDTTPLNAAYQGVIDSANTDRNHEGSLFISPIIGAWHYSSKLPFAVWNSPFASKENEYMVQMQARQLENRRLVRSYQQAKDERSVEDFSRALLDSVSQSRTDVKEVFGFYNEVFPGKFSAEEQAVYDDLNRFEKEIRAANSINNVAKRAKQLQRIFEKYQERCTKRFQAATAKFDKLNREAQNSHISADIASLGEFKEDVTFSLETLQEETPGLVVGPWEKRLLALGDKYIRLLKELKKDSSSLEVRKQKWEKLLNDFSQERVTLFNEFELWRIQETSRLELLPDESSEISTQP